MLECGAGGVQALALLQAWSSLFYSSTDNHPSCLFAAILNTGTALPEMPATLAEPSPCCTAAAGPCRHCAHALPARPAGCSRRADGAAGAAVQWRRAHAAHQVRLGCWWLRLLGQAAASGIVCRTPPLLLCPKLAATDVHHEATPAAVAAAAAAWSWHPTTAWCVQLAPLASGPAPAT